LREDGRYIIDERNIMQLMKLIPPHTVLVLSTSKNVCTIKLYSLINAFVKALGRSIYFHPTLAINKVLAVFPHELLS